MHILLSAYACLPYAGTEPGNGWNWAMQLAKRGIRVHVLTVTEGREAIEAYCALHPQPLISFSYVPVPQSFRHTSGMHYAMWQWLAVRVARVLHRSSPFDLVHHVTYSSIHVPTQLWRLGLPTVFGPVGGGQVTPAALLPAFGAHQRSERLRTAFTRLLPYSPLHRRWLGKMSIVLATNTDTVHLAQALGRLDVRMWFDAALPQDFFTLAPRQFHETTQPLRLVWIGRMVPRKALPLTLDSLAQVQEPTTLTIVGDGLDPASVRRLISDRGLGDRVNWVGKLSRDQVRETYLNHDALLFAGLRDSCPAQLVEAMGVGLPVITLDHHGAADLVPHGAGLKVPITDVVGVTRDLAAAIDRYATLGAEERSSMSEIGWTFARNLNYTDGAERFEHLYREIIRSALIRSVRDDSFSTAPERHSKNDL